MIEKCPSFTFQMKTSTRRELTNEEKLVNGLEKDHLCVWQVLRINNQG